MPEYIERKAIPLKKFIKTAQMFADDIACAFGTDWMEKIAEAENKKLFEIIKAIQEAPTADVAEVKRGEWIKQNGLYSCSVCGKTCPYEVSADLVEYWTCHYCPNCGAKMDGGKQ